jgi:hypothetical protein
MPRRQYNDGMEIIYQDLDSESSVLELELYDRVIHHLLQKVDTGFFSDSFNVTFVGSTQVSVAPGLAIQLDSSQVDPEPKHRLIWSATAQTLNLAAPDTVHDRIDLICIKSVRAVTATDSRNFKDAITSTVSTQSFDVETDWSNDVVVVEGTPSASPAVPSTPSGYLVLAPVLVTAVNGVTGQGDITDQRALLPVAGESLINTTGYNRAPVSTATPLNDVLAAFDSYLKNGYQNYTDFDDLVSDPSAPGSNKQRMYIKGGVAFLQNSGGSKTPLGSGGGGGGSAVWNGDGGTSPLTDSENGEKVWLFEQASAGSQKLTLFLKVPQSYISGRQILMYLGQYSPSSSGTQLLRTTSNLIRVNVDAVSSTTNQRVSTNTAITNTVANQYRQVSCDLTDSTGKINGFNVSAGDLIRIDLARSTDTDTADIRFIPSSTEVKFA